MKTSRFVIIIGGVAGATERGPCFAVDTPSSSKDASVSNNSLSDQDHALAQAQEVGEYRIGPEDVLDISSGTIARLAGPFLSDRRQDIAAAGQRCPSSRTHPQPAAERAFEKADGVCSSPEVSVIVREVHSFKVSVIGEVKKTGRHELKGRATVLDILAMAEGFGEFAGRGRIVVLRPEGKTMRQIPFNYNKVMSNNGAAGKFLPTTG